MKVLQGRIRITMKIPMAVLLAILCSARPTVAQKQAKSAADFWPFSQGNTWTIATTVGDKKIIQVITVTRVEKKDGKTRAELEYTTGGRANMLEVYEADTNTIARVASGPNGANKITPPLPVVQFPLTAGKTWSWKGEIALNGSSFKGSAALTVSGPETVKTETTSLSAMRVHMDLEISSGDQKLKVPNDYWFAPNVGLVKQKATLGAQVVEGIISSYKLAK